MTKKTKILIAVALLMAVSVVAILTPLLCLWTSSPIPEGEERVVAYITADSIESNGLDSLNLEKITHAIYAFAFVKGGSNEVSVDREHLLAELSEKIHRDHPNVKLMLSVATHRENDGLCEATRSEQNRSAIVNSCLQLMNKHNLDGFDLDWEYPGKAYGGCGHCTDDHASLLEAMRNTLPQGTLLSFASGIRFLSFCYDNTRLKNIVDFVNVMNYDFSLTQNSSFSESKINTFNYLVEGYSKSQINWGMPLYGRCTNQDYDYYDYSEIVALAKEGKAKIVEKGDFSYAIFEGQRLSFDTLGMLKKKTQYVKQNGYGGVFLWHLGCDTPDHEATNMIWDVLKS